jgi:penicillin-binding protein 1C
MGSSKTIVLKIIKNKWFLLTCFSLVLVYYFILPQKLFDKTFAAVLFDRSGILLSARLPADEQWRFPPSEEVSQKMAAAILLQEDRYFHYHWGFNPWSLIRAAYWNIKSGQVLSGASTISMQTIRLSRDNPPRTISEKLWEILLATRLEWRYSKKDILKIYLSHAPFGGNVVGIEAASWRYFGRSAKSLSWSECATLAVLPNAPGLINPGRNRTLLKAKRDLLLLQLQKNGYLNENDYHLALLEPLPEKPRPIPNLAPHLLSHRMRVNTALQEWSSIDVNLQSIALNHIEDALEKLSINRIYNAAILLIDNENAEVLAYVGNAQKGPGFYNDMLQTERSSGSILKPFLYAAGLQSGQWLPQQIIKDIPIHFEGFHPKNFDGQFRGMVNADQALIYSLNIPAVVELRDYGLERFANLLRETGITTLHKPAKHYGLSLILGGAEVKAWDLAKTYSAWAQKLNGKERPLEISYQLKDSTSLTIPYSRAVIWQSFEVMKGLNRPGSEQGWQYFGRSPIAWKTGTSFGFRDAWAVGVSPKYTCVVWVGNASGEGRPGLIGAEAAGPILFNYLNTIISERKWFEAPYDELTEQIICRQSGQLASSICPEQDTIWIPYQAKAQKPCKYHRQYYTDKKGKFRYTYNCSKNEKIYPESFFQLPVIESYYYAKQNPGFRNLPPLAPSCQEDILTEDYIDVLFPMENEKIFIPKKLAGGKSELIVEVVLRKGSSKLFWHLNGKYLGLTADLHTRALSLQPGSHNLWLEDENGHHFQRKFSILQQ